MNIIYTVESHRAMTEADEQTRHAVRDAMRLTAGKVGFRTATEIWWDCDLVVTCGHDIRTAAIEIRPPDTAKLRRRSNWRNSSAYYRNGAFWGDITNTKAELI